MKNLAILLASLMMVACASSKSTAPQEGKPAAAPVAPVTTAATVTPEAAAAAQLAAQLQKLHNDSVYFDYNQFVIKPEFRATIEKQATHMKSSKHIKVVLEGNCDERGSAAYNLSLGEKRATSVKKILVALGIPAAHIKLVSYGNSKPVMNCHEEKCWHENRRVDFVFKQ